MSESSPAATPRPISTSPPLTARSDDWKSALMELVSTRMELIRIELADFRKQSARRAATLALAAIAGASGWLLLMAAAVPLLASAFAISWPTVALVLAGGHFLLVVTCLAMASRSPGPAFPATLAEFQKDREWIENLSRTPES